jgi:Zn-dependent protease with chaperone function
MHIDSSMKRGIPDKDFRQAQAVNALCIVPAIKGDSVASLFSTHPSTEERVERLMAMQRYMESQSHGAAPQIGE